MQTPVRTGDLAIERAWLARGATSIAGADEVGRGSWAGPLVAAVVVFPAHAYFRPRAPLTQIDDSKRLTPSQREALVAVIQEYAWAWGIGEFSPAEISLHGLGPAIHSSIHRALHAACQRLGTVPDVLLTDSVRLVESRVRHEPHVKADQQCLSVAAASILAKVHRDRLMVEYDRHFPGYGFARNKGYGTAEHQRALAERGPCLIHRFSFVPVQRWFSLLPAERAGAEGPAFSPLVGEERVGNPPHTTAG